MFGKTKCLRVHIIYKLKIKIHVFFFRKTLRKESSNRRAVKRKDINEYHEIGLSPGQPLKKRKIVVSK